jgi:hypothetical protein
MADLVRAGERDRGPYRARPARPPAAGDGAAPHVHDLTKRVQGLSGRGYVIGELDTSYRDAGGTLVPGLERVPLRIRTPPRCGHGETVCAECAESWMFDWVLYFSRTAGGRRLREEVGEEALAAMARRRAAWGTGAPMSGAATAPGAAHAGEAARRLREAASPGARGRRGLVMNGPVSRRGGGAR